MRHIISLALTEQTTKELKAISKKRGFASVSDYIRALIEQDRDLISADQLLDFVREAEAEYKAGKAIKAKSMADLL